MYYPAQGHPPPPQEKSGNKGCIAALYVSHLLVSVITQANICTGLLVSVVAVPVTPVSSASTVYAKMGG